MSKHATVTSLEARVMSDYASGMRGQGATILLTEMDADGRHFRVKRDKHHGLCSDHHDVVTPVDTPYVQPNRPGVEKVEIQAQGMSGLESLAQYDAVFWSESAVEKFVFPYYASKYQWQAAHVLTKLTELWYGFIPRPGVGPAVAGEMDEEIPFAVGHLPRSDYVELADEMYLISRDGGGRVRHRPLSEFM
jgi:hypothetical protein